jgi:hypothetical protein
MHRPAKRIRVRLDGGEMYRLWTEQPTRMATFEGLS